MDSLASLSSRFVKQALETSEVVSGYTQTNVLLMDSSNDASGVKVGLSLLWQFVSSLWSAWGEGDARRNTSPPA